MSKHKSIARSVLVEKENENLYLKTIGYFADVKKTDLYCKCGYVGSGKIEFHEERNGKKLYRTTDECPMCEKQSDTNLNYSNSYFKNEVDLAKIWDNGEKISLHFCYTMYHFNQSVEKIASRKNRIALTFNAKTGIMYFMKNKGLVNWTFVSDAHKMKNKAKEFFELLNDQRARDKFVEFLNLCIERRGVKYYDFEHAFNMQQYDNAEGLRNIFAILRYPVLQDMSSKERIVRYAIPQKARKLLVEAKTIKDVYKNVLGIKTKKGVKIFNEEGKNAIIPMFSNALDTQEGFDYFCKLWLEEYDRYKERRSKYSRGFLSEFMLYAQMDFNHSILNKKTLVHFRKHKNVPYDELDKNQLVYLGLKHLKSFYKKESTFLRKLFYAKTKEKHSKLIKTKKYKINATWKKTVDVPIERMISIVEDIYRMYAKIKQFLPELEVRYTGDIIHYHDVLVKTERRIKVKDEQVVYSQEELDFYDEQRGSLQISLVKTTNELVKSGTEMNICVPSYAPMVLKKERYILFVYQEEKPKVCIELYISKKGIHVAQVKGYANRSFENDIAIELAKYFNERNLPYGNCYDMEEYKGVENSVGVLQNKKLLPVIHKEDKRKIEVEVDQELLEDMEMQFV